jgi:hypothetical protein
MSSKGKNRNYMPRLSVMLAADNCNSDSDMMVMRKVVRPIIQMTPGHWVSDEKGIDGLVVKYNIQTQIIFVAVENENGDTINMSTEYNNSDLVWLKPTSRQEEQVIVAATIQIQRIIRGGCVQSY